MKTNTTTMALAIFAAVLTIIPMAFVLDDGEGSDGASTMEDGSYVYCYGNTYMLNYSHGDNVNVTVEWYHGDTLLQIGYLPDEWPYTVDLSDIPTSGMYEITQKVTYQDGSTDQITITLVHMQLPPTGNYSIRFIDGTKEICSATYIDKNTAIVQGQEPFFYVPAEPVKEGYEFDGWYNSPTFNQRVDPKILMEYPVTTDLTFYAHWARPSEAVSSHESVQGHNVTIRCGEGIQYSVISNDPDNNLLTIATSPVGGYAIGNVTMLQDGKYFITPEIVSGDVTFFTIAVEGDTTLDIYSSSTRYYHDGTYEEIDTTPANARIGGGDNNMLYILVAVIVMAVAIVLAALIIRRKRDEATRLVI